MVGTRCVRYAGRAAGRVGDVIPVWAAADRSGRPLCSPAARSGVRFHGDRGGWTRARLSPARHKNARLLRDYVHLFALCDGTNHEIRARCWMSLRAGLAQIRAADPRAFDLVVGVPGGQDGVLTAGVARLCFGGVRPEKSVLDLFQGAREMAEPPVPAWAMVRWCRDARGPGAGTGRLARSTPRLPPGGCSRRARPRRG